MISLLKYLVIVEGLIYSIYAICRVQISEYTMPIALVSYALAILIHTVMCELSLDTRQARKDKDKPE